jgi:2-polyprenyl-6-hydroxyphenyl methylase/3-demethylubiquinone-9 3-methyltransferase
MPVPCKICGVPAPPVGKVDFSKSCEARHGLLLPPADWQVTYHRCPECGFLFTPAFDGWSIDRFITEIYNDQYILVDPDYAAVRPDVCAKIVVQLFGGSDPRPGVLDYGGGEGRLADHLTSAGFAATTYDPMVPAHAALPEARFDLVTCFETLEHVPDPLDTLTRIAARVRDPGLVLFSTALQPEDFAAEGLGWWYVAPRNGHISIFSAAALHLAWRHLGFRVAHFSSNLHLAWRTLPDFARHMFPNGQEPPA